MKLPELQNQYNIGLLVFAILVFLTLGEYLMVLMMDSGNLPWMIIMNIVDAWLILYFFMHISQLWRQE
jgi:heme/copper-type cytochrome/quinol oxidase subunit 4